jgi:hypothetical protein
MKKYFLIVVLFLFCESTGYSASNDAYRILLSRLNLETPGLERVKAAANQPDVAMNELLTYFRKGGSGKHPINKNDKAKSLGNYASKQDFEWADNALQHKFIGSSAYPPYFCGNDINWLYQPVPDNEWVWQLNRMSFWHSLARVYWHTGDEKYAKEWAAQLLDWTRKNPNDAAHAVAWRSIEAGIRGYQWMDLFQYFIDSPSFTPEVLAAFLNSSYDHASFLMTKYSTHSNWGLMEAEGMAFIAIIFPQFKDAVTWRQEAFRRLTEESRIQVYPDGHQCELTYGYHSGCISWFLRTYELAKLNGIEQAFPASYLETIQKMCEVPMKICLPDGRGVVFGDGSPGSTSIPVQTNDNAQFVKWAELFGRKDFLYIGTHGREGVAPAQTAYALPYSGIYSMRSGWDRDAVCLVLKCGPDGGWHCQPDNGTFDLYAGGRNLMPDGGCYVYSGDDEGRAWFRQTRVHKTLTLDNKNSKYAPKLLQWSPGENVDVLVVENGSYDKLTHRRSVFFVDKEYYVIIDEAIGTATGQIDLHFQLAPVEIAMDKKNFSVSTRFKDGWNVAIRTNPQNGLSILTEEGQIAEEYATKKPRPAFSYQIQKKTAEGVRFVTVLTPFNTAKAPEISVEFPDETKVGSSSVWFKVKKGNDTKEIGYTLWQDITTVDDVCKAYPGQVQSLFKALNLDYPGLENVKSAYLAGNLPLASKNLLAYYGKSAKIVPKDQLPTPSMRTTADGDTVLKDTYTFQEVKGRVPRLPDGHLMWACNGPQDDIEWAWALNRHYPVLNLVTAYNETGNLDYVKYIDSFIKSWIICSWPYPGVKSNTAMWRGLEVHFRQKVWNTVFYNLWNTDQISPATRLLILTSIPSHAHYNRNFHARGNWLTMEMSALATSANGWPELKESPAWLDYTVKTMVESMKEQVYPDGVQNELSSAYHQVALGNFALFADICKDAGVALPAYFLNTLADMWNYIALTIRPDGQGLLNNDSDLNNNREAVLDAADKYKRPEWAYIASNGEKGVAPTSGPSCFFPWAGQLISRSGFDKNAHWSFFDIGPWGTGHQHNDKLHLSVMAYGRHLLVDAGRFAYMGDVAKKFRGYALGSQGHNLVLVDGKGQQDGPTVFTEPVSDLHYSIQKDLDYGSGTFDKYKDIEGKFSHTRSVIYVKNSFWIVADQLKTDRPRTIETLWHWHPACVVNTRDDGSTSTANAFGNLTVIPVGKQSAKVEQVKGQESPVQGWYSRVYNVYEPNTTSVYTSKLESDNVFVWILWPSEKEAPKMKTTILSEQEDCVTVQVSVPGKGEWTVQVPFLNKNKAKLTFKKK